MQKNWIGKSYGTEIDFVLEDGKTKIPAFTTRPDTLYGVTYVVLAPEHPVVEDIILKDNPALKVKTDAMINEDKIERTAEDKEKEGFFTGKYVTNPVNGEKIPLWVGNYVLMDYGTGAVMAVPAHDERDFLFAGKYDLPLRVVIEPEGEKLDISTMKQAYTGEGILVNSDKFDGMKNNDAKTAVSEYLEEIKGGLRTVNYRLHDWLLSRQRYWGTPIPALYCEKCGLVMEKIENLPVKLPMDIEFSGVGNPLETSEQFKNVTCPVCGGTAKRETDTMDTFVDSSWYYLRFLNPNLDTAPFDKTDADNWTPVDQYIGGVEHAVMHLLYARFFHKVLRDMGLLSSNEPFRRLLTQGMVLGPSYYSNEERKFYFEADVNVDNKTGKAYSKKTGEELAVKVEKMSKSKNNGVDPEVIVKEYGADSARVFSLFAAPPEKELEWNMNGLAGAYRFLNRLFLLIEDTKEFSEAGEIDHGKRNNEDSEIQKKLHQTVKKVSESMEDNFHFNTAIAALMELLNDMTSYRQKVIDTGKISSESKKIWREVMEKTVLMLSPFAPHIADELWSASGREGYAFLESWPEYIEELTKESKINLVVQVNGKLRDTILADVNIPKEELEKIALASEKAQKFLEGKEIVKVVVVPNKLVNIVVK